MIQGFSAYTGWMIWFYDLKNLTKEKTIIWVLGAAQSLKSSAYQTVGRDLASVAIAHWVKENELKLKIIS